MECTRHKGKKHVLSCPSNALAADVWIVTLPIEEPVETELWPHVSEGERRRAERLRRDADRRRYLAAHTALRSLLASRLHARPAELTFAQNPFGKPSLQGHDLQFSLSSSGDRALIGVCASSEIGVDIEAVAANSDHEAIARAHFSSAELRWMQGAAEPERCRRFYRLWVIREALLKALGIGLSGQSTDLGIEIVGRTPRLRGHRAWEAHEAPEMPQHVAAAVLPRGVPVAWHEPAWRQIVPDPG
jgi:4'-phosphopantetheinyl transferase